MGRAVWLRRATLFLIGGLAVRALWLAWQYYFAAGPRYRVESAVIALVIVGAIAIAFRRGDNVVDPASDRIPAWWLAVLLLAAPVLYHDAIAIGFLSDDYTLHRMAQSDDLGANSGWFFRPVPLVLWRGLLAIVESPAVLHLLNLLLHGLNAALVALLGHAMGMRRDVAIGAAMLFLTFPVLAEAVVWAAGIQDVLMTTAALAAVVLCARDAPGAGRMALVCGLLIIGFGSKETAVSIPILIALCWATPERVRRNWTMYAAVAAVTVVYLAIRLPMGVGSDYFGVPTRYFFKQMIAVAFGTLAAPWRAPSSGSDQWQAFIGVGLVVLLVVHALMTWGRAERRLQRDLRLGLWVLASIAPVFTLFYVGPTLEGSRYLYLASCAWSLILADLIASASERLRNPTLVFRVSVIGIALVFAVSVQREVDVWRQAADLRDRVLANARTTIDRAGCTQAAFTSVPDSLSGAYVFRNGFPEALGASVIEEHAAAAECRFAWVDGGFSPSR